MKLGVNPEKAKPGKKEQEKSEKKTDDETLKRFLGLLGEKKSTPKVKRQVWSNDDVDLIKDSFGNVKVDQQQVESRKRGGKGIFVTRTHIKFDDEEEEEGGIADKENADLLNGNAAPNKTVNNAEQKEHSHEKDGSEHESEEEQNDDFIEEDDDNKSKEENGDDDESNDNSEKDDEGKQSEKENEEGSTEKGNAQQEQQVNVDEWEEGRLFVRNLSFDVKEDELQQLFKRYGTLNEVHLPIDPKTGKGKGYAHIMYMIPQNALQAYKDLDGKPFQGRLLHILPGKRQLRNVTGMFVCLLLVVVVVVVFLSLSSF